MLATHWSNALWCQIMKHRLFLQKESADGRQIDKFEFRLIITLISLFHYNKATVFVETQYGILGFKECC